MPRSNAYIGGSFDAFTGIFQKSNQKFIDCLQHIACIVAGGLREWRFHVRLDANDDLVASIDAVAISGGFANIGGEFNNLYWKWLYDWLSTGMESNRFGQERSVY